MSVRERRNSCDESITNNLVDELTGGLTAAKLQREDASWRIEAFRARLAALSQENEEIHINFPLEKRNSLDEERFSSFPALVAFATGKFGETKSHYYDLLQVASSSSKATRSALQRSAPLTDACQVVDSRINGMPKQRRLLTEHTEVHEKEETTIKKNEDHSQNKSKKDSSIAFCSMVSSLFFCLFGLYFKVRPRKTVFTIKEEKIEKEENTFLGKEIKPKKDIPTLELINTQKSSTRKVALVSSNFGRIDAIPKAPRQRGECQVSFFFFTRQRNLLASLRGWTLVLPWRRRKFIIAQDNTTSRRMQSSNITEIFSKTWDFALSAIDKGRRSIPKLKSGQYPQFSRKLVSLPFDLESLEHTRRFGIDLKYQDAQSLVDVMAPKFVKLQMFRIDVLLPYEFLVWADASLVFDDAAVNRAMRPLIRNNADLVVQPHPKRNSTLEEIRHILAEQSQPRFVAIASYLRNQLAFYENATNFIDTHGLYWMAYFGARRSKRSIDFFDRWWLEVRRWQYRDQVSVMYALTSVPETHRPRIATFDTDSSCCKKHRHRLAPEQALCATLVGDFKKCCRRCTSIFANKKWLRISRHGHHHHHHHNNKQQENNSIPGYDHQIRILGAGAK